MPNEQARDLLKSALDLARSGDYAGARRDLEELLRSAPDFADGHYYHGLTCSRLGDPLAAKASFERCLEIDPFYHAAREQLRVLAMPEADSIVRDFSTPAPAPDTVPPSVAPPAPERPAPPPVLPPLPPVDGTQGQSGWAPVLVKPAGFWIRGLALLCDTVLAHFAVAPFLPLLMVPFYPYLGDFAGMGQEELAQAILERALAGDTSPLLMWSLCGLILLTAEMTFNTMVFGYYHYVSGQTPGKRLLGVRVVDATSLDYLTAGQSIWRYAASTLNTCFCGLSYLLVVFNPERRALHDYMASTRVVFSERVPMELGEKAATAALILLAAFGGAHALLSG